jgi:ABC-type antimicrobial peptide transport system permease subunit
MKAIPLKYNVRSLLVRRVTTALTVGGVAFVVGIFVLVLSLANGLRETIVAAGSPDNLLVLSRGARGETESGLSKEMAAVIGSLRGVKNAGTREPCVSPELVISPILEKKRGDGEIWTDVRGVHAVALWVHDLVRINDGRMLRAGSEEVMIGKGCSRELGGLVVGDRLRFGRRDWLIVGLFDSRGTKFESEIWADLDVLMGDFHRNQLSSITVKVATPGGVERIAGAIERDPRLPVKAIPETSVLKGETQTANAYQAMGLAVAFILAGGALFGAMNTMYAAVAGRVRDIATLRALGFSQGAILISFLVESILISLAAGILGCLLASLSNGLALSTMNLTTWSNLSFALRVSPGILVAGLVFSLLIGIAGGLLPALQAARLPITLALREV